MHSLLLHGGGIAECPACGAVYRLTAERDRGERGERGDGFDCCLCGDRLETCVGHARRTYELVPSPQASHRVHH
jgi:hypothetical protein